MGLDFIFILKAIIIAVVEGVTEFLPISSTGHMILVGKLIGFYDTPFVKMFQIVIQLGAISAIVVLYWDKIWTMIKLFFKMDKKGLRFWLAIIVATLPAVVFGFLLEDLIEEKLFGFETVIIGLIVGGILLVVVENNFRKKAKTDRTTKEVEEMSYRQALLIGLFQCLAMWPGMSRSSSTIMGGWIAGLSTTVAAEFSFFLGIPIMIGASTLKLAKFDYSSMTSTYWIALLVGFIVSFIVALVVVDGFVSFLKKKPMRVFAVYRIFVGILLSIMILTNVIK
ncbi:undecaprenyl-diphosphatase [Clostridium polyendosporum]|uniref:Undecaprenyl-diphosphatase n=1 Tax=Clostridium polyendosporum TaxID=69208 RepID=A0A919S4K2_9CLOT|nr:undecaprenyl-diphosphate phosphatase [Clostridium polyendosporum]GIM30488.1 undecaprenyl-diphosphatase [Clostridium polyendosporum]